MKKTVGRPKKAENESLAPGISLRLTKQERKEIDAAIDKSGLSQSDWARKSLLYVATQNIRIT